MYLDPGFGGAVINILIALVATGGAIIFAMRRKIKVLFSKNKATENIGSAVATLSAIDSSDDDAVDILADGNKNE